MIYSHANPLALAANGRNIRDDQIDACVATGGIVCVNGVGRFLGDPQAGTPAILRHIDYLVQRVGADHVGLGLDYVYDQGLDDDPPGLERARWWPPEHGYGRTGRRSRSRRPSSSRRSPKACSAWATPRPTCGRSSARTCWASPGGSGGRARRTDPVAGDRARPALRATA